MISQEQLTLINYTEELAKRAEISDSTTYATMLVEAMSENENIVREYIYYLNTGKFLCEYDICGVTIADIIIWQMDHFKSLLDDYTAQNKTNQYKMVLEGFSTMIKMEKEPQKYLALMGETTGTDYLGKY